VAGGLIRRAWEESARSGEARAPWPWADTRPVARLKIPRLGYDEIVLDDATPRVLAFGPALLLSGARPGRVGNVVVAGHRTSWFRGLEGIAEGDTMEMEWFDARRGGLCERRYKVETIRIVEPSEVRLQGATGEDALTLITCYPFGRGPRSPKRFVVRGVPVGASWRVGEERNSKNENGKINGESTQGLQKRKRKDYRRGNRGEQRSRRGGKELRSSRVEEKFKSSKVKEFKS
jgi:sortase A